MKSIMSVLYTLTCFSLFSFLISHSLSGVHPSVNIGMKVCVKFLVFLLYMLHIFRRKSLIYDLGPAGPCSAVGRAPQRSWVRYPVLPHTFSSPSADSRGAVVSYWRKYVHEVLVNRLGGLSLPRKSVVRLTDHPDMTLDVYCGHKTTTTWAQLFKASLA